MHISNIRGGVLAIASLTLVGSPALAFPPYLQAWKDKYPTSTIPQRMLALTGSECNTCHHPPDRFLSGTCYRMQLRNLLKIKGHPVEVALDILDGLDSDGDGVSNGIEILTPRADQPGQIGYHMGLIGPTGTDPCGDNPMEVVTGMLETPAQTPSCPANCDGSTSSPVLNINDFACFLNLYAAGDSRANCDGSTSSPVLNVNDFACFLNAYAAGCS
ncbi:MAG: GC-type dockerin domain-anchored protein [Phycisphaerales bacterium]